MADKKMLIRYFLIYEYKSGTNASRASYKLCSASGEVTESETSAYNCFLKFRCGNESLEDESRARRPISLN